MGKLTTCSIEGCAKAPEVRGWCKAHYLRWYRHGDPLAGAPMRHPGRVCSVADCGEKCSARGYCAPHYRRWAAYGDPLGKPPVKAERGCAVDACGDKHEARGYCRRHYNRLRAYGDPLWEKPPRAISTCSVEGCENPMRKRAWCASHYAQWTRGGGQCGRSSTSGVPSAARATTAGARCRKSLGPDAIAPSPARGCSTRMAGNRRSRWRATAAEERSTAGQMASADGYETTSCCAARAATRGRSITGLRRQRSRSGTGRTAPSVASRLT